jgi:ComEC/Rec2-related protein
MSFFQKIYLWLKDWRVLLLFMLFSNFYWLLSPSEHWLQYQFFLFALFCLWGIVFSGQRLFFLGALLLCFVFHHQFFFSKITSRDLEKCNSSPEFLEANLSKKTTNQLLLSQVSFFCERQKFTIASITLFTTKKYIPAYAGEKIRIIHPKMLWQDNRWVLKTSKQTRFFPTKQKILREQRGEAWNSWKQKSNYYLEGKAKELYQGIALADRSSLTRDLRHKISILGIFHLFAISGLHIGMIYLWVHFFISKLFNCILLLLPKQKRFSSLLWVDLFSVFVVWCYLNFLVFPITAVRAWIMLFMWVLIRHFFRWMPSVYILFLTAAIMMLLDPSIIFSLSFQFSFLAVFAILVFSKWVHFTPTSLLTLYKNFFQTAAITIAITVFTAPLTLVYFQKLNLLGFLNNPFHIFFIGFAYLPLVLLGFVLAPLRLEKYYFWLMQKVGDFWYWVMEKNFIWSEFATFSWKDNFANQWWLCYALVLGIFSIWSFQRK